MIQNKHVINALPLVADALGKKYGVRVFIGGETACTNGKDIHLPGLPLDSDETMLNLARAYIDHESAHLRDTDFQVLRNAKLTPLEHHIWNILEDWRVEQKLVAIFPGCRHNLNWLIRHLFLSKTTDDDYDPTPDSHLDSTSTDASDSGPSQTAQADQPSYDPPPALHILNWILLVVRTWDVFEIARERDAVAQQVEKYYPGLTAQLSPILSSVPHRCDCTQDCIDVSLEIVALLKRYIKDSPSAHTDPKTEKQHPGPAGQQPGDAGQSRSAVQHLCDLLASRKTDLPKDIGSQLAESLSDSSQCSGEKLRVAIPTRKQSQPLLPEDLATSRQETTALRTRLQALLQSSVRTRSRTGYRGRLDTRSLHRLSTGDIKVFRKHGEKQGIDTAIHILLDCSGSMAGTHIQLAGQACFAVASALHAIPGITVAVTAFPGEMAFTEGGTSHWRTVAPILKPGEKMHSRFSLTAAGATPMGEAIWWTQQQMHSLREKRKIVLLITDGNPDYKETTRVAIRSAQTADIEVYGIGIGNTSIQSLVPSGCRTILTLPKLAPSMFAILSEAMLGKR